MTRLTRVAALEEHVVATPRELTPEVLDAAVRLFRAIANDDQTYEADPLLDGYAVSDLQPAIKHLSIDELGALVAAVRES